MTSHMSFIKGKEKKTKLNRTNLGFDTHTPNLCVLEA